MSATARDIEMNPEDRAIEQFAIFLPPTARRALRRLLQLSHTADVAVDELLHAVMRFGEELIQAGLDNTIEGVEGAIAWFYDIGTMEWLGQINPFLRDGAEIGIQLGVNALKALTPADVAKIVGLIAVALIAPNLMALNAPEFIEIGADLAMKLWTLP